MDNKIEIPGIILLVDDKITNENIDESGFSLFDLNKVLVNNGYNTIMVEPDSVIMLEQSKQNYLKDVSILITDLSFTDGTNLDENDVKQIKEIINKILEKRSRLLVLYLSTLFGSDDSKNKKLTKEIEDNYTCLKNQVKFIGHIPKSIFLGKDINKLKIFSKTIEDYLKQENILDRILMFHWECLIRNSIDKTINQIYESGENSIDLLCEIISKSMIEPIKMKKTGNNKNLIMSLKVNELFSLILNSQMKNYLEANESSMFKQTIEKIREKTNQIKQIKDKKESNELTEKQLKKILEKISELISLKQYSKALDKINNILKIDKENTNAKLLKKEIIKELKEINYNAHFWEDKFYSILNYRFVKGNNFDNYPIFPGLILVKKSDKDKKLKEAILVVTPKCDIPFDKTHFMTCIKLVIGIKSSIEIKTKYIYEENYYKTVFDVIDIRSLDLRGNLKRTLLEQDKVFSDRFYCFKYLDENTKFKRLGIADFSQILSISADNITSDVFVPFMIIEDDLLNDMRIHYVKYINRFGIFDFNVES